MILSFIAQRWMGAVKVANKNIKRIVEKMAETYKNWHETLFFALHVYWTSIRTSIGATLFSLVYWMEAVLPIEVEILLSESWWKPTLKKLNGLRTNTMSSTSSRKNAWRPSAMVKCIKDAWSKPTKKDAPMIISHRRIGIKENAPNSQRCPKQVDS